MTKNEAKSIRDLIKLNNITIVLNPETWEDFLEYCKEHPKFYPEVLKTN